jgi:predicted nucleic acid-binding protein
MSLTYLDTSAIAKLVISEAESDALASWLDGRADDVLCTSVVGKVELLRAARRHGPAAVAATTTVIAEIALVPLDAPVLELAASIEPDGLRTLVALHVASAVSLGSGVAHVVTYDARMVQGVRAVGLSPASPGAD